MGRRAAGIVNFMARCGWSLAAHSELDMTGGFGQGRERNLIFRKDSLGFQEHFIVELQNSGRIYLNGDAAGVELAGMFFGCHGFQSCYPEKLCDAQYVAPAGYFIDDMGTNLSKSSVELVDWLSGKGWTLRCGGSMHHHQRDGSIRQEHHLVFARVQQKHTTPWSALAVEFRVIPQSLTSYSCVVEVSGEQTCQIYDKLLLFFTQDMLCEEVGQVAQAPQAQAHCDHLLSCNALQVRGLGLQAESNFGRFSTMLCDFMADHLHEWTLVSNVGQSYSTTWKDATDTPGIRLLARQQLFIFLSSSPAPLQQNMSGARR